MINVYEQVDRNKRRSFIVMVAFLVFIVAVAWIFSKTLQLGPGMMVGALVFAFFMSFASYWWGDKIVLATTGARPADRASDFNFYTVAENLSIAAGISKPALFVIDDPSLNAFATGRDPDHAVVCATTGLLAKLDRTELEGVVAHELSHIKGYDTRLMTIVGVLVGMVILLSDWFFRGSLYGRGRKDGRRGSQLQGILFIFGVLAVILSPIIAQLIQLAISRRREFLADAQAVMITRFPEGLARALQKISKDPKPLRQASGATAHLFIVNPFKGRRALGLFSTHPPVEERIKALGEMS